MDIKTIIENNDHRTLVDLKEVSLEDRKDFVNFVSEGSTTLGLALRTLWNKKLYTTACCAGHLFGEKNWLLTYMYSYIAFAEGVDVFKYLSDELVNNPYVTLGLFNNSQAIYFYGRDKDKYMLEFINDIMKKRENNSEYLPSKINKPLKSDVREKVRREYFLDSGFTEEEIKKLERIDFKYKILDFNKYTVYTPDEEYDKLFDECVSVYDKLKSRKINKKKRGR